MINSERSALAHAAAVYELGTPGSIVAMTLIAAPSETLSALAAAAPSSEMEEIFSFLTGGRISNGGFCAAWDGRYDLLEGLRRFSDRDPELLGALGAYDITMVARNDFSVLVGLAKDNQELAVRAFNLFDLYTVEEDLAMLSTAALWTSPKEILMQDGPIPQDEQAALLGMFLRDMEGTKEWHVLGTMFMSTLWRVAFFTLTAESETHFEMVESALEVVNSFASSEV